MAHASRMTTTMTTTTTHSHCSAHQSRVIFGAASGMCSEATLAAWAYLIVLQAATSTARAPLQHARPTCRQMMSGQWVSMICPMALMRAGSSKSSNLQEAMCGDKMLWLSPVSCAWQSSTAPHRAEALMYTSQAPGGEGQCRLRQGDFAHADLWSRSSCGSNYLRAKSTLGACLTAEHGPGAQPGRRPVSDQNKPTSARAGCLQREQQGLTTRCKSAGRRGALAQAGEGAAVPSWPHAAPGAGGCLQAGVALDWLNRSMQ